MSIKTQYFLQKKKFILIAKSRDSPKYILFDGGGGSTSANIYHTLRCGVVGTLSVEALIDIYVTP